MAEGIRVAGFDPSLRHWGIACGMYYPASGEIVLRHIEVIEPVSPKNKQIKVCSKDLMAATQLAERTWEVAGEAQAVFAEIPVGSQSARGGVGNGVVYGILGSLQARNYPIYELSPTEVKLAAVGSKTASKQDMIDWATALYPTLDWPSKTQKGVTSILAKAEHIADAIAAIHAGVSTTAFKKHLALLSH